MSCKAVIVKDVTKYYFPDESAADRILSLLFRNRDRLRHRKRQGYAALDNVSISVEKGSITGIIGRNGAGKSTLLRVISGLCRVDSGSLELKGRVGSFLELGIGFDPYYTGLENVKLAAQLFGLSKIEAENFVTNAIEFADIGDFINQPVSTYSSGMYSRIAFSVQSFLDYEVMIIDEALSVGDVGFVQKCMARLTQLKNSGRTVLFVSHDMTAVKSFCDQVYWIDEGRVVQGGQAGPVVDNYLRWMTAHQNQDSVSFVRQKASDWGSKKCTFEKIDLTNADGVSGGLFSHGDVMILCLSVRRNTLVDEEKLVVGVSLRNRLAIDLASANASVDLSHLSKDSMENVFVKITIPYFCGGRYFCSIALTNEFGKTEPYHVIDDGLSFEITATPSVKSQMGLVLEAFVGGAKNFHSKLK